MGRVALTARMLAAVHQETGIAGGQHLPPIKMLYAVCDRRGVIEIVDHVPSGMLGIIAGAAGRVRELMSATARHAHDGKTLLVPGIPEADTDDQALDALIRFRAWLSERHPRMVARASLATPS